MQSIFQLTIVVHDYDEAIAFYTEKLGFDLIEDTPRPDENKRWVVVSPPGDRGASLLLAEPKNDSEAAAVGNQTGGRVFLFLETDDFWRDYNAMKDKGVVFKESPREEEYGTVIVFEDICGNQWDLIEPDS